MAKRSEDKADQEELLGECKKLGRRRYSLVTFPDGSKRITHIGTRAREEREQVMADFLGVTIDRSERLSMRGMPSILSEISERLQIREETLAPEMLAEAWRTAMGDFFATQAELFSLCDGLATIRTLHPNLRFELNRMKRQVIAKLNEQLGAGSVRKLRIIQA